jgi:hypothetical protein
MPFGLTPDKDERRGDDGVQARPDALRHAFNSPFRPFVLATTSIGQEGLDFHVYCDRLVHWDLPASPVDLEQRDGRINRYGGLAIRKVLAQRWAEATAPIPVDGSPWLLLTRDLAETCEGMAPWWGTEGAAIRRTVFLPPLARQESCLNRMILFGERSLRRAIGAFVEHYHHERNHQGVGNQLIFPAPANMLGHEPIACRPRLGGLLKYYHRPAA